MSNMFSSVQNWFDFSRLRARISWRPGGGGRRSRRRASFNRERRVSFPEVILPPVPASDQSNEQEPTVGYEPKTQPEQVNLGAQHNAHDEPDPAGAQQDQTQQDPTHTKCQPTPSGRRKSQNFIQKYLFCCSCCCGRASQSSSGSGGSYNAGSYSTASFDHEGTRELPVNPRVTQPESSPHDHHHNGDGNRALSQLSADELIKSVHRSSSSSRTYRENLIPVESSVRDHHRPIESVPSSHYLNHNHHNHHNLPQSPQSPQPSSSSSSSNTLNPLHPHQPSTFLSKLSKKSKVSASSENSLKISTKSQHRIEVSTKRLMKELSDLMRRHQNARPTVAARNSLDSGDFSPSSSITSSSSATNMRSTKSQFTVELVNDLLYEWYIKIHEFDKDSQIAQDMQQYKVPYVQLHAVFPDSYPFDPPFIRVVSPFVERGYVMEGGAICLELLTKHGWTSAYTMEAVIIQLMASFVKGQARIKISKDVAKCFTRKSAENSFRHIVRIHDKHGWVDTPVYEG